MMVVGIDPGTRHLGWGILRVEGTRISHVAHGVVDTDTEASIADRLCQIDAALAELIAVHQPTSAAVESLFFSRDPMAAAKLGHARGVVLLAFARAGVPITEYEPARVKRAIAGNGRAEKPQVAMIVSQLLRLPEPPRSDAADALAIALVHARAAPMLEHIARVEALAKSLRAAGAAIARQQKSRRASCVRGGK